MASGLHSGKARRSMKMMNKTLVLVAMLGLVGASGALAQDDASGASAPVAESAAPEAGPAEPAAEPAAEGQVLTGSASITEGPEASGESSGPGSETAEKNIDGEVIPPYKPLTMDEARKLIDTMGEYQASQGFSPDHLPDGCYWRAHLGEEVAKLYVSDPSMMERGYVEATDNTGIQTRDPITHDKVVWGWHTDVVTWVRDQDGNVRRMVLDPAANANPIPLNDWARTLTREGGSAEVSTGAGSTSNPDQNGMFRANYPSQAGEGLAAANRAYDKDYRTTAPSIWAQTPVWGIKHNALPGISNHVWKSRTAPARLTDLAD